MSRLPSSPRAGLDQRLFQRLKRLDLEPGSEVAVAFSGGNDSLALALALSRCAQIAQISPVLLHIDHGLREQSASDAVQCRTVAESIGQTIMIERLPNGLPHRSTGLGLEEQARRERYLALARLCKTRGITVLATGHHLDDQAETVLLHLFRGAGLSGASGMREVSRVTVPWWSGSDVDFREFHSITLWRPFLSEPRSLLEHYVEASFLTPAIDESNMDIAFRRNAIRHEILPAVIRHFPGVVDALGNFGASAANDDAFLWNESEKLAQVAVTESGGLRINDLTAAHPSLAARVALSWLREHGVSEPTRERVVELIDFARSCTEESQFEAGNGRSVVRFGESLQAGAPSELIQRAMVTVVGPWHSPDLGDMPVRTESDNEHIDVTSARWRIRFSVSSDLTNAPLNDDNSATVPVAAELNAKDITVRCVQTGDIWSDGSGAVRESLREAGVHPLARHSVICLATGKLVLFIPGISRPRRQRHRTGNHLSSLTVSWEESDSSR